MFWDIVLPLLFVFVGLPFLLTVLAIVVGLLTHWIFGE